MTFLPYQRYLQGLMGQADFAAAFEQRKLYAHSVELHCCEDGARIFATFPGYKDARAHDGRPHYDFRVDLVGRNERRVVLSHVHVIGDLVNKVCQGGLDAGALSGELLLLARDGEINLRGLLDTLQYQPVAPTAEMRAELESIHQRHEARQFRALDDDLALEQLFHSLKWITLQEQVNYPPPRYQGRRMPFARYLEAIHVAKGSGRTLEEVIARTLQKGKRPRDWPELSKYMEELQGLEP